MKSIGWIILGVLLLTVGYIWYANIAPQWQMTLSGQMPLMWKGACIARRAVVHTVQAGETLWGISTFYALSPECIQAFNGLDPSKPLSVGEHLAIPLVSGSPFTQLRNEYYGSIAVMVVGSIVALYGLVKKANSRQRE